jgi:hypothetical protein
MKQIVAHGSYFTSISSSNFLLLFRKSHESHFHFLLLAWRKVSAKFGWGYSLSKLARIINFKPFIHDIVDMNWV